MKSTKKELNNAEMLLAEKLHAAIRILCTGSTMIKSRLIWAWVEESELISLSGNGLTPAHKKTFLSLKRAITKESPYLGNYDTAVGNTVDKMTVQEASKFAFKMFAFYLEVFNPDL